MRRSPSHLERLLASLEEAGCQPRPAGPGRWVALCPTCKLRGWDSVVEIRESGVVACVSAHERPVEAAA